MNSGLASVFDWKYGHSKIEVEKLLEASKIVYESHRRICEFCGDFSNKEWSKLRDGDRSLAIEAVRGVWHRNDITPEEMHLLWLDNRTKAGWKYGKVKSYKRKTHPSMIPYDELSEDEKFKDAIVIAVAKAALGI